MGKSSIFVARLLNISDSLYSRYEKEKQTIPLKYLIILCNYFDASIDYLFGFTNIKTYENYNEVTKTEVGKRLKNWRKEQGLTQEELAKILNTVHQVIANYENGKNLIATPFLYTICKKYNISADYLLGRVDTPKYLN